MRRGSIVGVLCLLLAPHAFTQKTADFSGRWVVDEKKTALMLHDDPPANNPPHVFYEVTQTPETITVDVNEIAMVTGSMGGAWKLFQQNVYKLDGTETKTEPRENQTCKAKFSDGVLTATCTSSDSGLPLVDVRTFRREDSWLVNTSHQSFKRKENPEVDVTMYWKPFN